MKVIISKEKRRGCGYRKAGNGGVGIYLMGQLMGQTCERLPFPVETCPCCGGGIKFARSWRTITPSSIFLPELDPQCDYVSDLATGTLPRHGAHNHDICPLCDPPVTKHGLVWIGHQHYTVASFCREAAERGVSRKLPAVPRDMEIGETFVYLAHIKAVGTLFDEGGMTPGVFMVFRPTHVDLVIDDADDVPEKAKRIASRLGDKARLVKVIKEQERTR